MRKDRTGWGAAVLLLLLGVPYKEVKEDYLLTNRLLAESGEKARYAQIFKGMAIQV